LDVCSRCCLQPFRDLEKKLKNQPVSETIQRDSGSKQSQGSSTSTASQHQQQQQQQAAQAPTPARLQVCLLHTADVPATPKTTGGSSCSSAPAVRSSSSSVASVIRQFEAASEDSSSSSRLDMSAAADCSSKGQQSAATSQQQQQQQDDATYRLQLQPPRTPDPCEADHARHQQTSTPSQAAAAATAAAAAPVQAEHAALLQREQQQQQTINSLQRQLSHMQMLHGLLQSDYGDLEFVLKETERQRREYAARYAFVCLDGDGDGYLSVEQVGRGTGPCQPQSSTAIYD
jgi:hypothetical protein